MNQDKNGTTLIEGVAPLTQILPGQATIAGEGSASPPGNSGPLETTSGATPTVKTVVAPPGERTAILAPGTAISRAEDYSGVAAAAGPDPFVGQELCGYTIRRKLAEGGMGVVYEGVHGTIGRTAAIKVLKLEYCRSEEVVERFYQEARAVNSIRHENIVDIYDFGRDPDGRAFFVMEYLVGEPLSARVRRGLIPWPEAYPILEQTLRALQAAHDQRFVHRDLKPDNIWLKKTDGRVDVKLLDFGIAKLVGAETPKDKLTKTGSLIGTPHYMSPEQINGSRAIDQRTDIYALGVIIYEMFAGVTPFVGDTLQAIMSGHLFREPPRLEGLPAKLGVPAAIVDIVDRMLMKDPGGRYDSASEVLSDLRDLSHDRAPATAEQLNRVRPTRAPSPAQIAAHSAASPSFRGRTLAIASAIVVAAIAATGGAVWRLRQRLPAPPPVKIVDTHEKPKPVPIDFDALRKRAQTTLRAALHETEPAVRVQGSDALGKIKDQPSVPALTDLTEHDPDGEVRGHTAAALAALGATPAAALLARLEAGAPAALKVWYASALARLGERGAVKRLLTYARDADPSVSFPAALMLADLSPPGDKKAIAALAAIAVHADELEQRYPYAQITLATKLTALRDAKARQYLYGLLAHTSEGARLAAAEGLAKLGHDAGKQVLHDVAANPASPNRLVAAVAQIPLGEYGGLDVITQMLGDKNPENRRLAARGLGDIADRQSLTSLTAMAGDPDWTVRLAAARAIVAIVGLDPLVLAQAAVDWTKSALDSQDLAVRRAAAGVLADIPATDAIPLLAVAIADKDPAVRREASKSAGRMKSAAAAARVVDAVKVETDPAAKEQEVKALGEIGAVGSAAAHDTLAQLAAEVSRLGVIAAGSLIAVGDIAGNARLETAIAAPRTELRLAAEEAAGLANNPIVVPTLKLGLLDHVLAVRFLAALGLATYNVEKAAAVPVLHAALDSKDFDIVGRALAALVRFGETIRDAVRGPAQMLDSTDATQRLAAVRIVRALPSDQAVPLLRRLVSDADPDVRHAGVDAIRDVTDKDQAIKLYKPLVTNGDPIVRAKAAGQLSRLVPPAPPPPAPGVHSAEAAPAPTTPTSDPALPQVQQALAETRTAANNAKAEIDRLEAVLADLVQTMKSSARDDSTTEHVKALKASLDEAPAKLEAMVTTLKAAAKSAAEAAGATPSSDVVQRVAEAQALAQQARDAVSAMRARSVDGVKKANDFVTEWTGDAQLDIDTALAKIDVGAFAEARRLLDRAARQLRRSETKNPGLDFGYALMFDKMAVDTEVSATKVKLLEQAIEAYRRLAKTGGGRFTDEVNDRLAKLPGEIDQAKPR